MFHQHAIYGTFHSSTTVSANEFNSVDHCFDCILNHTKAGSKDQIEKTKNFFLRVKDNNMLEAALLTFSKISASLEHEALRYEMGFYSYDKFLQFLMSTEFFDCASSILRYILDDFSKTANGNEQELCTAYYICSIVGHYGSKVQFDLISDVKYGLYPPDIWVSQKSNKLWNYITSSGILPLISRLINGEMGVYEQIKGIWALRQVCISHICVKQISKIPNIISIVFNMLKTFNNKIKNFKKKDFKRYEVLLSCMGIGNQKSYSFAEITPAIALKRLPERVTSSHENALEALAMFGLVNNQNFTKLLYQDGPEDVVQYALDLAKTPRVYEDDECLCISTGRLITNLCINDKSFIDVLYEKYNFPKFVETFILAIPPMFLIRTFLISFNNALTCATLEQEQQFQSIRNLLPLAGTFITPLSGYYEIPASLFYLSLSNSNSISKEAINEYKEDLQEVVDVIGEYYSDITSILLLQFRKKFGVSLKPKRIRNDNQQQALKYKKLGNNAYKKKDYKEAIQHYKKGLKYQPQALTETSIGLDLHNNISICYLLLEEYDEVLYHTNRVLLIQNTNFKALARRATALFKKGSEFYAASAIAWDFVCEVSNELSYKKERQKVLNLLKTSHPVPYQIYKDRMALKNKHN